MPSLPSSIRNGDRRSHPKGFTTIELMVVIAIVAILAAIAAPSFGGIIERYRVRRATEDLTASLYLARSEAIRRGGNVTMARYSPSGCTPTSNKDWSCGWIIFADADNDGILDADEERIQISPPSKALKIEANFSGSTTRLRLNRWGLFNESNGAFNYKIAPANTANAERLCVSRNSMRVSKGEGAC
ncbi:MAG: GspH/FimT family protein [Variovorax sp.]|nr:GspH/FimT family protein [Variovorax sp.]